jgi:DNA-directed RNA polymerase specialized sigma24 family protein
MTAQDEDMYELFRRAIVERDADAWATIRERFRPLLISWAGQAGVHGKPDLDCAESADQAFTRAWAALSPERFADFPNLAQLLSYLRTCVATAVIDGLRQQAPGGLELPKPLPNTGGTAEQIPLMEMERAALWDLALAVAATAAERVALVESFVYNLPPRAIYARHPQLFASVADVYSSKRYLLDRLGRN